MMGREARAGASKQVDWFLANARLPSLVFALFCLGKNRIHAPRLIPHFLWVVFAFFFDHFLYTKNCTSGFHPKRLDPSFSNWRITLFWAIMLNEIYAPQEPNYRAAYTGRAQWFIVLHAVRLDLLALVALFARQPLSDWFALGLHWFLVWFYVDLMLIRGCFIKKIFFPI
jgi:hypothetical protein